MTDKLVVMDDPVTMHSKPSLRDPVLVMGFGGWPNAGEVSTWTLSFLVKALGAMKCAEIRPDDFYDFTQQRPIVTIQGGRIQSVDYPSNAFYRARTPEPASRDLVLFRGQEPHLQWRKFTESFLDVAQRLGIVEIIAVGGLYDNVPHTVAPTVSGLTNGVGSSIRLSSVEIRATDYHGPVSIYSNLLLAAAQKEIPAISLWGHVPYYIQSSNAKTCLAVLERLQHLLGFQVDLTDMEEAAEVLAQQIERFLDAKPELREYIDGLEQEYASGHPTSPPPKTKPVPVVPPGEKIIDIDLFRHRDRDPEGRR